MHDQTCLVFYLGDRVEVPKQQKEIIKELGLRYRGNGNWPYFLSYKKRFIPNHINDIQAFYEEMLKTSSIEVDFDKTLNNPVITLSTCTSRGSDSGERNVVHAVLDKAGIDPKVDKMEE